jgi:hypothetical protein
MKRIFTTTFLFLVTLVIFLYHFGTAQYPMIHNTEIEGPSGKFLARGINQHRHIFLSGSDYHRGAEFGRLTKPILELQEELMVSKLDLFLGNSFNQKLFLFMAMNWFHGLDTYIDQASLKEMFGVSISSPTKFDYLANAYNRQIAYHGIHEVGQMFVDEDKVDMGCFATAIFNNGWVIGRNFDFDIDGLFDREKILKWSYPDNGNAYLSIIWSGMVGVVTGVNEKGIYGSTNAAGSDDFSRAGTPTTILLKNILTNANNLEEAIKIVKETHVFISEIFLLADAKKQQVAVIEKSPDRITVNYLTKSSVIANHFVDPLWVDDITNSKRKLELTSDFRFKRGQELLIDEANLPAIDKTVSILRDRSLFNNRATHLGHSGAIDSLIASQSVIYDLSKMILYINLGPGTIGKYLGYDLKESFLAHHPVIVAEIKSDKIDTTQYQEWHKKYNQILDFKINLKNKKCSENQIEFEDIAKKTEFVHYNKSIVLGDYEFLCNNNITKAKAYWSEALEFNPPYKKIRAYLERKLK